MNRVALFAHYDAQDRIKPYLLHHLTAPRQVREQIHFVSTARLPAEEPAKLDGMVANRLVVDNVSTRS